MQEKVAKHSTGIKNLAKLGYASRGVIYATIGILAAKAALGNGGKTTDTKGAIQTLGQESFGQILLVLFALGLLGYSLWRFIQGFMDPEHEGNDKKGLVKRAGYIVSGIIHLSLTYFTIRLLMGSSGGQSGNQSAQSMTARMMENPFGVFVIGTVGAIIIGFGIYQIYKGYQKKFRKELKISQMSHSEEKVVTYGGMLGLMSRGIVFGIIGYFLIHSALTANPNEARGLDGTLQAIASQPSGAILLAIVAIGLALYGVYSFMEAKYRRIRVR